MTACVHRCAPCPPPPHPYHVHVRHECPNLSLLLLLLQTEWEPKEWRKSQDPIVWSPFISTILWNLQGFDNLGCIAGEVKNVKVR